MRNAPIRLVLADDHPIVLHGLRRLLEQYADLDIVCGCSTAEDALAAVLSERPDVLVLDLRMPGMGGLGVLRELSTGSTACRTILLTAAATDAEVVDAVRLGALGLVLKEASPDSLVECIRQVHRGRHWIDRATMARAFDRGLRQQAATREASKVLTAREIEIALMVAEGARNKAIADRLAISEGTVKIHLHNVYQKLGVDGRIEMVLWVQKQGLR